jgi:hypothetical protein
MIKSIYIYIHFDEIDNTNNEVSFHPILSTGFINIKD